MKKITIDARTGKITSVDASRRSVHVNFNSGEFLMTMYYYNAPSEAHKLRLIIMTKFMQDIYDSIEKGHGHFLRAYARSSNGGFSFYFNNIMFDVQPMVKTFNIVIKSTKVQNVDGTMEYIQDRLADMKYAITTVQNVLADFELPEGHNVPDKYKTKFKKHVNERARVTVS